MAVPTGGDAAHTPPPRWRKKQLLTNGERVISPTVAGSSANSVS